MLPVFKRNLEAQVVCPKCGTATKIVVLSKVQVHKCEFGCGVWINQVDLDALQKMGARGSAADIKPSLGLFSPGMLVRR